jgi:hypothetical protein
MTEAKYGRRNVAGMIRQVNDLRQAIRAEGTPAIQSAWDAVEEHIDYAYRAGIEPPRTMQGVDFSKLQTGDALVTARKVSGVRFSDTLNAILVDGNEEGRHPQG